MLLGVKPLVFLARLLFFFALTYVLWVYLLAPLYTKLLVQLTQLAISATELFGTDQTRLATTVFLDRNTDGIFFTHKFFPGYMPPGVPGDWVQANIVLLVPLMLATPAPDLRTRLLRLALALALALGLQVLGLVFTIKVTWSSGLGPFSMAHYNDTQREFYGFADAFFESFDTQLFPVAIWAGIHFRPLLAWVQKKKEEAPPPQPRVERERRRTKKKDRVRN